MSIRTRKAAKDAQTLANVQARYDAGGTGRRMRGWTPPSTGPQRALEGLTRIRDRSRDAIRNDWAATSSTQKWTTTLVGVGITPRWENERHTAIWEDFVPEADADGACDAYAMQGLAVSSWLGSGEVFQRRRWRSVDSPLALPVQVQLIESDYCPVFDADLWPGMPQGNRIRQGKELNKYGRVVAFWFYKDHPGDGMRGVNIGTTDLIRVPASEISHVYEVKRPGQLRGVSELAPVLARLRSAGDLEDTVLERQKIANLFAVLLEKPLPTDWQNLKVDANTGLPVEWTSKGQPSVGLEPGVALEMLPGEKATLVNPPEAGVSFADYIRTLGLGTAAGGGLPYELMSGDIRDVSDRTFRVVIQEFRRFASQRQWHLVIPKICRPMVNWLGEAAVVAGRLRASELRAFQRPEWAPHGWDYIHPVQDVEGKKLAIEAGITSQSAVIAETGEDPRKVLAQRAKDQKDNEALGLPAPGAAAPVAGAQTGEGGAGGKPGSQNAGMQALERSLSGIAAQMLELRDTRAGIPPALEQVFGGLLALMQNQSAQQAATAQMLEGMVAAAQKSNAAMEALALALANRPIEQHTHVAPAPVNVAVEPTPVQIEQHTHVEPTPVQITNSVDVPPANVTLHMPTRQTVTEVLERDDDGNAVRVAHTQTTVQ